jgi:hypothetical protein
MFVYLHSSTIFLQGHLQPFYIDNPFTHTTLFHSQPNTPTSLFSQRSLLFKSLQFFISQFQSPGTSLKTEIFCEDAFSVVCDLPRLLVPGILLYSIAPVSTSPMSGELQAHGFASGTLLHVPSTFTTRLTYCNAVGYKTLEALQENSPGVSRTGTSLASSDHRI